MFARVLGESGLTKVELAQLYQVSRQTIHYWAKVGPPREGTYTARMAESITKALLIAVERHILPLSAMAIAQTAQASIDRVWSFIAASLASVR